MTRMPNPPEELAQDPTPPVPSHEANYSPENGDMPLLAPIVQPSPSKLGPLEWVKLEVRDSRQALWMWVRQNFWRGLLIGAVVSIAIVFYILPDARSRRIWVGGMSIVAALSLVIAGSDGRRQLWAYLSRKYNGFWDDLDRRWEAFQESRLRAGVTAGILAYVLMWLSAQRFLPGANDPELISGFRYMVLGFLSVGFGLFAAKWAPPVIQLNDVRLRPVASNSIIFLLGAFLLIILAESNGHLLGWQRFENVPHQDQFVYLVAGISLVVIGLGGVKLPQMANFRPSKATGLEWLVVIGVTALAVVVRLWRLETAAHWFVDELNFGTVVSAFWGPANIPLLHPEIRGFPTIFAYLQNWGVMEYGRTLYGLRFISVVFGAATIPAVYLLGREMFDKHTGFMAAVLLAALPPHIQFSRLALNNIGDPLFGTLAFAFMTRAFRTQNRADYALSGASLGLTQYFYEGGRLLYPPLMVVWVCLGLILWRPQPSLKGLIIAALAAFMIAMPIYYTLEGLDLPMTTRFKDVGRPDDAVAAAENEKSAKETYLPRLKEAFRVYVNLPEFRANYYAGDTPLLLEELVPLFLLGGAFAFWRWRNPAFLLFMWIVAAAVGNSLIQDSSVSARFVVAFPVMALLAALGIRHSFSLIAPREFKPRYQTVLMVGIVAALFIVQVDYFMGPHMARYNVQIREAHAKDGQDALFRSVDFPSGTQVFIIGNYIIDQGYAQGIMGYLKEGGLWVQPVTPVELTPEFLDSLPRDHDLAFFLPPEDVTSIDRLRRHFTLLPPQSTPYDIPENKKLVLYYAPAYVQPDPNAQGHLIEPLPQP